MCDLHRLHRCCESDFDLSLNGSPTGETLPAARVAQCLTRDRRRAECLRQKDFGPVGIEQSQSSPALAIGRPDEIGFGKIAAPQSGPSRKQPGNRGLDQQRTRGAEIGGLIAERRPAVHPGRYRDLQVNMGLVFGYWVGGSFER